MTQRILRRAAVLMLLTAVARAQAPPAAPSSTTASSQWTVNSGQVVGRRATVLRAEVGWPGAWLDLIHGLDRSTDLGIRAGLSWGGADGSIEGLCFRSEFSFPPTGCSGNTLGATVQVLLRAQVVDSSDLTLALTFNPGVLFFFSGGSYEIVLPLGAQMGFPLNDKLVLDASFEIPFAKSFPSGPLLVPLLFGGGMEYRLQPDLLLTVRLAAGPSIPVSNTYAVTFSLNALAGIAYRFH